jgi:transcription initiation factor TFIIF subunit beta
MERWSAVTSEDVHLATVRVYNPPPDKPNEKTRIILFLPPNRDPMNQNGTPPPQQANRPVFDTTTSYTATGPEPDCYELDMVNESVENQIVVAERPKDPSLSVSMSAAAATPNTRARTTILTGRIKHECNLRPAFTANYRKQMKERHRKYNTPKRQIKRIETANLPGGMGAVNRLSSGVGLGAGNAFGDLIVRHIFITQPFFNILMYLTENETKTSQGYL